MIDLIAAKLNALTWVQWCVLSGIAAILVLELLNRRDIRRLKRQRRAMP